MRFTTDTIWTLSFTDTRPFWKYGSDAGTKNSGIDSERGTTLMGYNAEVCGHMIKELRESRSISRTIFADDMGITRHYVSVLEGGNRDASIDLLCNIADYFGVSLDYLIRGKRLPSDVVRSRIEEAVRILQVVEKELGGRELRYK